MNLLLPLCQGLLLFMGLVIFMTGRAQAGQINRVVTGPRARWIGALLMAPLPLTFCGVLVYMLTDANLMLQLMALSPNTDAETLLNSLPVETINTLSLMGLFIPLVCYGLAVYLFFSSPAEPIPTPQAGAPHPLMTPPWATPPAAAPTEFGKVLTVPEAARYLKRTEAEVIDLINTGKLPASRAGSGYQIARSAIDDMLADNL
jgi:excisionase family DNA binding protein